MRLVRHKRKLLHFVALTAGRTFTTTCRKVGRSRYQTGEVSRTAPSMHQVHKNAIANVMHVARFLMSCMIVSRKRTTLGSKRAGTASINGKKAVHRSWWTYQ